MKPFAVFQGTTEIDGRFIKLEHPGKRRFRFRVDLWIKARNGTQLVDQVTTKAPCRLNDLMEQTITPAVDKIIAEAAEHGGTERYGFSCYKWG